MGRPHRRAIVRFRSLYSKHIDGLFFANKLLEVRIAQGEGRVNLERRRSHRPFHFNLDLEAASDSRYFLAAKQDAETLSLD